MLRKALFEIRTNEQKKKTQQTVLHFPKGNDVSPLMGHAKRGICVLMGFLLYEDFRTVTLSVCSWTFFFPSADRKSPFFCSVDEFFGTFFFFLLFSIFCCSTLRCAACYPLKTVSRGLFSFFLLLVLLPPKFIKTFC